MEAMSISKQVKAGIEQIQPGVIFGLKDFDKLENPQAVALELSRLTKKGTIQRLTKGKYFVPKKTKFGTLRPDEAQILENLIKENGGYFAGVVSLNRFGVTTQVPAQLLVRGARSTRKMKIGSLVVQFVKTGNPEAGGEKTTLVDLIEAVRLIKRTPDGNISTSVRQISLTVAKLSKSELLDVINLLKNERPYVRAIIGAVMEKEKIAAASVVKATLNPLSKYKIGIDAKILPNKNQWGIV